MIEAAGEQQAASASARVLALYAAYQARRLTKPDAEAAMAAAVYAGKVLASRLADISISTISNLPPLGIAPGPQHVERLEEAVSTILTEHEEASEEEPQDPAERLDRLATAETLQSHRASLHAAIRDHGFSHWERVTGEDPCEICAPLAGEIKPIDKGFRDHPGCRCSLIPHGEPASVSKAEPKPAAPRPLVTIRRIAYRKG